MPETAQSPPQMTGDELKKALNAVIDPEIYIGIYDLGLLYTVTPKPETLHVDVEMTWTSFACPYGPMITEQVKEFVVGQGYSTCDVKVVFEPQWDPRTMASDEVKMRLGLWDAIDDESLGLGDDDDDDDDLDDW